MEVVVCLKPVLDPNIPATEFRLDPTTWRPNVGTARLVMDSYAEHALEVAIQIKEKVAGTVVTALCVSDSSGDEVLRRALALRADRAVRAWDSSWRDLDAPALAHVLAQAIRRLGDATLVLTGREASDIERGLVGPMLAEELGVPCVTRVARVEVVEDRVRLRRETDDGFDVVECRMPAVLTITSDETNVPRLPKVKDTIAAGRKPIQLLGFANDLDPARLLPGVKLRHVFIPPQEGSCEIVEGQDGASLAVALVRRMNELNLLSR